MFWNYAKTRLIDIKNLMLKNIRSIVAQLTLLYTASILIILLIISLISYFSLAHSLYKSNVTFLTNEYHLLQKLLSQYPTPLPSLQQEVVLEPTTYKEKNRYYIRILDSKSQVVIETPNMSHIAGIDSFSKIKPDDNKQPKITFCKHCHKKSSLLLSGWIAIPNHSSYEVQIALITHKDTDLLEDYWQMLITISLLGVFLAAITGIILAKKTLQPFKKIIHAMEQTTTSQLHDRLTTDKWPKEFKHLADHFNAMLERLDDSFQRLTQLSGDLAHELRTPINILKGEAEICLMKNRSIGEYQQIIVSSLEEYDRLIRLIENLLFLARVDAPQTHLNYSNIDGAKMLKKIIAFYLPVAEERNVSLNCSGDAFIWADELLLQRALHNLLSNALRYTPSGGKIDIKLASSSDGTSEIRMCDTGVGIAPEHLAHMGERFYRGDLARTRDLGGSGLGLAIVKSIMKLHHGELIIQSNVNQGTSICLCFLSQNNIPTKENKI